MFCVSVAFPQAELWSLEGADLSRLFNVFASRSQWSWGSFTRVKLYSRPGNDLTDRFSLIVEALAGLRSRSCIIDGEAVACDERGIAAFDLIRYRRNDGCVFLYAFDLIELNGDDLRRRSAGGPQATLASVLAKAAVGIRFNAHMDFDDGEAVFYHTCLVSKRKDSTIAPVARRIGLSASASALINRNPKR